jgi:uncharacterized iron-regulated membrane protein
VIWEPFVLALVLGLVVSGGLYFAYLWPSVEPLDDGEVALPLEPALATTNSAPAEDDDDQDSEAEPTGTTAEPVPESKAEAMDDETMAAPKTEKAKADDQEKAS